MKVSALLPVMYMTYTGQAFGRSDTTQPPTHLLARYVDDSAAFEQALIMRGNVPLGPSSLAGRAFVPQQHSVSVLVKRASPPASPRASPPSSPRRSEGSPSSGGGVGSSHQARGGANSLNQPGSGSLARQASVGAGSLNQVSSARQPQNPGPNQSPRPPQWYLSSGARAAMGGVAATGALVSIGGLTNWADTRQAATAVVGMSCIGAAALSAACIRHLNGDTDPAQRQRTPTTTQPRAPPSAAGNTGGRAAGSSLEMSNIPLRGPGNIASDDPSNLVR